MACGCGCCICVRLPLCWLPSSNKQKFNGFFKYFFYACSVMFGCMHFFFQDTTFAACKLLNVCYPRDSTPETCNPRDLHSLLCSSFISDEYLKANGKHGFNMEWGRFWAVKKWGRSWYCSDGRLVQVALEGEVALTVTPIQLKHEDFFFKLVLFCFACQLIHIVCLDLHLQKTVQSTLQLHFKDEKTKGVYLYTYTNQMKLVFVQQVLR